MVLRELKLTQHEHENLQKVFNLDFFRYMLFAMQNNQCALSFSRINLLWANKFDFDKMGLRYNFINKKL